MGGPGGSSLEGEESWVVVGLQGFHTCTKVPVELRRRKGEEEEEEERVVTAVVVSGLLSAEAMVGASSRP